MKKLYLSLAIGLVSQVVLAESSITNQLARCAALADNSKRLTCYDELAAVNGKTNTQKNEYSPPSQASLPDSIGGGEFAKDSEIVKTEYQGRVTSCKQNAEDRWFYFFENEQVWKQVDRRKRRHRECLWNVTISRDGFGYVMRVEGEKSKIRIRRIR